MSNLTQREEMPGIADAFLRDRHLYGALLQYITEAMPRNSEVSTTRREIIAACVSRLNGCQFGVGFHYETLRAMGFPEGALAQRKQGDHPENDSRMSSALRYVERLTRDPQSVSLADIQAPHRDGWSEQAIEAIVNVAALFASANRLVDAFASMATRPISGRSDESCLAMVSPTNAPSATQGCEKLFLPHNLYIQT